MTEDFQHPLMASDEPSPKHHLANKVYAGMWGKTEIISVAIGGVALIATIALFIVMVVPARKKLSDAKTEQAAIEQQVTTAKERYGKITTTEEQVARLVQSANDFEAAYLPVDSVGLNALYERLNTLIAKYGLVNTSGPEYTPLDLAEGNAPKDSGERGREKYRSIFPGVYVTMTVDGTYADIRRFISDIETSEQFVIISAVGLEPSEGGKKSETEPAPDGPMPRQNPQYPMAPQAAPRRTNKGATVSLKIEMAAYFRRQNAQLLQQ